MRTISVSAIVLCSLIGCQANENCIIRNNVELNRKLFVAISNSDCGSARELIYRGAWFENSERLQQALPFAIICEDVELARVLIQAGADCNRPTWRGTTLLFEAVQHNDYDMIMMLFSFGATDDQSKLMNTARSWGHVEAIRALHDLERSSYSD